MQQTRPTKSLKTITNNRSSGELIKRLFASIVAAIFVVLVTAGCMKLDAKLTVSNNDTISGTVTLAYSNAASKQLDPQLLNQVMPNTGHLFKGPGVTETNYADGNYSGKSWLFTSVPIDKLISLGNDRIHLNFERDGDNVNVAGSVDTSSLKNAGSLAHLSETQVADLLASSAIHISITLPGSISYTNGKLTGNTVTWSGHLGDNLSIGAVATSKPDVVNWPLIGGIATVVIAAGSAFVLYFILKKRKTLYSA